MARVSVEIPRKWLKFEQIVKEEFTVALRTAGNGVYRQLGRQFEIQGISASGKTFKSIKVGRPEIIGNRMGIEIAPTGSRKRIMAFIEYGRRPGGKRPPLKPIMEWLRERKIVSDGDDRKKVRALAWYISRQIALYGIDARPIFETVKRQYDPHLRRIFEAAARRVVNRINGNNSNGRTGTVEHTFDT